MSLLAKRIWVFTSTGAGTAVDLGGCGSEVSFYCWTDANATCSITIETAWESSSPYAAVGSAISLTTGTCAIRQYTGTFCLLRPHVTDASSGTIGVGLIGSESR